MRARGRSFLVPPLSRLSPHRRQKNKRNTAILGAIGSNPHKAQEQANERNETKITIITSMDDNNSNNELTSSRAVTSFHTLITESEPPLTTTKPPLGPALPPSVAPPPPPSSSTSEYSECLLGAVAVVNAQTLSVWASSVASHSSERTVQSFRRPSAPPEMSWAPALTKATLRTDAVWPCFFFIFLCFLFVMR